MAIEAHNEHLLRKPSGAITEYNEALKKSGRAGSSLEINSKEDLKQQYQNFIKLLMTQLKHQDPSEPMKNEAFVSQLVKFSHLEQAIRSNETQNKVLDEQQITHLINASSFIEKEVEFSGSQFHLEEGKSQKLSYELPSGVSSAKLLVLGEDGRVISSYEVSNKEGRHTFDWDGKDRDSIPTPTGKYTIQINARDEKGNFITGHDKKEYNVPTSIYRIVEGAMMSDGRTKIKIGGGMIMPLDSILSIQAAATAA